MQKRQSGGVAGGGSATPVAKRGRPLGSVNSNSAAASATAAVASSAADSVAPPTLLGPSLHVHYAFAGHPFGSRFDSSSTPTVTFQQFGQPYLSKIKVVSDPHKVQLLVYDGTPVM